MDELSSSLVAALTAFVVSALTIALADFFGLRRDRERMRMEFDWQLRRQRWEGLNAAMRSCPSFQFGGSKLITSVGALTTWCHTEVEPWMGSDRIALVKSKRAEVEEWYSVAVQHCYETPADSLPVPTDLINGLRLIALEELSAAMQRMRSNFSQLTKDSSL